MNELCSFLWVWKFYSDIYGHVGKQPDNRAKVNFKIYDVPTWETNNYNTHIVQDLKK